jgi:zinc transport system permease protein
VSRVLQRRNSPVVDLVDTAEVDHEATEPHPHRHEPGCGHREVLHAGHVDYVHDGHRHAPHEDHYDEH